MYTFFNTEKEAKNTIYAILGIVMFMMLIGALCSICTMATILGSDLFVLGKILDTIVLLASTLFFVAELVASVILHEQFFEFFMDIAYWPGKGMEEAES